MSSSLRVVSKRSTWGKWFAGFSTDCCCCCCVCCCSWAVSCCCFPKNGMGITTSVVERGYGNWRISNRDVLIWFIFDVSQCPVTHTRFFHISFPISFFLFFSFSRRPVSLYIQWLSQGRRLYASVGLQQARMLSNRKRSRKRMSLVVLLPSDGRGDTRVCYRTSSKGAFRCL